MIPKPESVRYATPADEAGIMGLCRLLAEENGMFDMDEEKVRFALRRAVHYDRTICGVVGPSGDPHGAILLFVGAPWYAKAGVQILEELFNFVHPDHRKGASHAADLMDFAKHVADDLGVVLQIGVISNIKTEAKVRLYKRRFHYMGAFFTHNGHLARGASHGIEDHIAGHQHAEPHGDRGL